MSPPDGTAGEPKHGHGPEYGPEHGSGLRHRFDPAALLAGALFLSVALWFGGAALMDERVLLAAAVPILLIGLAVVGFVRVATRSRRR